MSDAGMHSPHSASTATSQSMTPSTSTLASHAPLNAEALAECIHASTSGLRIRGGGTWLDAGHPVGASHELRLDAFRGVRAYVPADLTISIGAATTVAELNTATAAHGQWCPLLSWGDDHATIGAVIATATAGPAAPALGRPRDLVLGLECVDGLGRIIRAGGRVVKNVAGFDLTRLMTGAWGTLGVITEVHLRLRARPAVDITVEVTPSSVAAMQEFLRGPLSPLAAHRNPQQRDGEASASWLVRIGGNTAFTSASRAALEALGPCTEVAAEAWDAVRRGDGPPASANAWRWNALSRSLKERFDPRNQLNPGLLGAMK
jgi:glycolate oxidase FAD binding subunit